VLSVPLLFKDSDEEQTTQKIPKGQSESLNRRGTDNIEDTKGAIRILK
jgi:hypothetical protein